MKDKDEDKGAKVFKDIGTGAVVGGVLGGLVGGPMGAGFGVWIGGSLGPAVGSLATGEYSKKEKD